MKPIDGNSITDHELLIRIHNQNAESIKILRSINDKLTFFVVVLMMALLLQLLAVLFL